MKNTNFSTGLSDNRPILLKLIIVQGESRTECLELTLIIEVSYLDYKTCSLDKTKPEKVEM